MPCHTMHASSQVPIVHTTENLIYLIFDEITFKYKLLIHKVLKKKEINDIDPRVMTKRLDRWVSDK